jgi:7-carboxy-7-deazaguanine synthase
MNTLRKAEIRVSEIFGPTIQGEGAVIGLPTVFVRTGGCDFRCTWCDSMHAVDPKYRAEWKPMWPAAILERVAELTGGSPILITLSGGNPALQPCAGLIEEGHQLGHTFALETQGSAARPWFGNLDYLTLSPKPPSSGMGMDLPALEESIRRGECGAAAVSLKVVVFNRDDLSWALALHQTYPRVPFYVQVGNRDVLPGDVPDADDINRADLLKSLAWLSERVIAARAYDVRVLPQLHTLMWGNARAR